MKFIFNKVFKHFNSDPKNNLYTGLSFYIAIPALIIAAVSLFYTIKADNKADEAIKIVQIQKNEIKILQSQIIEINKNNTNLHISNKEGQVNTISGGKVDKFSPVNK